MRRRLIALFLLTLYTLLAAQARTDTLAPDPDTLDEILACNAAALGGADALAAVSNLRLELDIAEPGFEVQGTYVASRDGAMRIDIIAGDQRVFAEGLHDGQAWQWTPDTGVTASSAKGAAALRNGIESPGRFWTLAQLRERGLQVELLEPGPDAADGEWQLRLTSDDGPVLDYFLDRKSCLPAREVSRRAFHPDVDPTEVAVETAFSEPVTVNGVVRFRHSEQHNLDNGEWLGTTVVREIEQNVELEDDFFSAR